MPYRVVSRFFDRTSGRYFDPGQECPLLPAEDAARLVRARCLEAVPAGAGAAPPSPPAAPTALLAAPRGPRRGSAPRKE